MVKYDISKLKFGSKINYKGNKFFVDSVLKRVIKARKIFDINKKYNPYGTVSRTLYTIPIKEIAK